MNHFLVTGGAGFIGSNLIDELLLDNSTRVTCIDNFDDFYDKSIKEKNIEGFCKNRNFKLEIFDIRDAEKLNALRDKYTCIIHLAAKAGVRPSIENPRLYQDVNVMGTQNMLEFAKKNNIKQFVYASSSSVYGVNPKTPWSESDKDLQPISPYASSKIASELLGHVYAHLYEMRFIALRFFTVYGPRQRPDLAIHKFCRKIQNGESIDMYGDGTSARDYTFVADIVKGIIAATNYTDSSYEIINIGNHSSIKLKALIDEIAKVIGKKAIINQLPMVAGDVPVTYASVDKAKRLLGYEPTTTIKEGLTSFKIWLDNNYMESI